MAACDWKARHLEYLYTGLCYGRCPVSEQQEMRNSDMHMHVVNAYNQRQQHMHHTANIGHMPHTMYVHSKPQKNVTFYF